MPIFRFRGFATGTPVDLSVTQGANSDSGAVPTWGQAAATPITVSLGATRLSGTAPFGAIFAATTASPAARVVHPYHDIETVWVFDDPGNFTALGNSPIWGTDRDVAYGPRATHVYSAPGEYTVTCTAHDGENAPKSEPITVTVENPNTVFAGADTAVVSQSSDFSGAPSDAAQFTSVSEALSHLSGRTNMRLLLRRGETFTGELSINQTGGANRRIHVGAFGAGVKPVIDVSGSGGVNGITIENSTTNCIELAIWGLRIVGEFDPTNPPTSGTSPNGDGINLNLATPNAHKTIWDVEIENVGDNCISTGTIRQQYNLYIGNCRFIGWLNYGLYIPDIGVFGISGSSVQQPRGTRNGSGKFSAPWYADHGPCRASRPDGVCVFSNCDFVSLNSWSHDGVGRTYQPCLRWNSGIDVSDDQELVVDRFRTEGGAIRMYNETSTPSIKRPVWALVDRWHHVATDHANGPVKVELGGTTVRNIQMVVPQTPPGTGSGIQQSPGLFSDDGGGSTSPGWNTRRAECYSSAFIDLRTDAQASSRGGTQDRDSVLNGFTQISPNFFGNNLHHAPNMTTGGQTGQAPLDTAPRWTPVTDGERWEQSAVDTSRDPTSAVTATFAPVTGSSAIGAATGKVSLLDMDGNLRSAVLDGLTRSTPSEGPYEPPLES